MSNDDGVREISELEQSFLQEGRGGGSLSLYLVSDPGNFSKDAAAHDGSYMGYDLHPEDVEALFFQGLGVLRWDSFKADTVDEQLAQYNESYAEKTAAFPLISRASDTDAQVVYSAGEVRPLVGECDRVLEMTADGKAVRAVQKIAIASRRAAEQNKALLLVPSDE